MRRIPSLLSLLFPFSGLVVRAQQPLATVGEVYSALLRSELGEVETRKFPADATVVIIPAGKASPTSFVNYQLAPIMKPPRLANADAIHPPGATPESKPALPTQLPAAVNLRHAENDFRNWLRADTSLAGMGRRFDALPQNTQLLTAPVSVPGYRFIFENPDFFNTKKFRNWDYFHRTHKHSFGIIDLSDVVFSADGRYAVFYVGIHQGGLNGVGFFAFMENTAQGWHTKFTRMIWIS